MFEKKRPFNWKVNLTEVYSFCHFTIEDDILGPEDLPYCSLPAEVLDRQHLGLIISGRGPVWLYARLVHEAHPFAWVATADPRLQGAVVVTRHRKDSPPIGSIIPLQKD